MRTTRQNAPAKMAADLTFGHFGRFCHALQRNGLHLALRPTLPVTRLAFVDGTP
jgi:hypothetical protein